MYDKWITLRNEIIFDTDAQNMQAACGAALNRLVQEQDFEMIANLACDLQSYLPRWITGNEKGQVDGIAKAQSERYISVLEKAGKADLVKTAREEIEQLETSNLIKVSKLADAGKLNFRWGNDNGIGIMEAMRRGAALVTTNPPIVNMARLAVSGYFDAVRDQINKDYPNEPVERRISRLTMHVVLSNCRALRRIYEKSNAQLGYVNFQVNPYQYQNADAMAEEIYFAYGEMKKELGGEPNVVFKVPGTKASLQTVAEVTAKGIGVNITVNFSLAQSHAFAQVIQQGKANKSYVTMMAGRLDDPISQELGEAGVADAAEVAKNASKYVTRKVYADLISNKFDHTEILVASLRGPWNFDASFTDDPASRIVLSSFPDKWAEYDSIPRDIHATIHDEPDKAVLGELGKSEIFKQAYYMEDLTPDQFDRYVPVVQTLTSFLEVYDELKEYMGETS